MGSSYFSSPLFIILGDFNDLNTEEICDSCNLNQIVKVPTKNDATLDKILTNSCTELYNDPISVPLVGKCDHLGVIYKPCALIKSNTRKKEKNSIRKFKESAIIEFGKWLINFNWNALLRINNVNNFFYYFT